jgi:hypothetical protein
MIMIKYQCIIIFCLILTVAPDTLIYSTGTPDLEVLFNETYGGILSDIASFAVETSNNGFLIVGSTNSYGAGDSDIWLLKINSNGVSEWNKTYGKVRNTSLTQTMMLISSLEELIITEKETWIFYYLR